MAENKSLYQLWIDRSEDQSDIGQYQVFFERYYDLETEAYRKILANPANNSYTEGSFANLRDSLGFEHEDIIFMGFLSGMNESLKEEMDLEAITPESDLALKIDFEKLLYNMHKAKAKWLFSLDEWEDVLPNEKRLDIARQYRDDSTLRVEKVGRNDPCPCGSGKKYKKCCGKNSPS